MTRKKVKTYRGVSEADAEKIRAEIDSDGGEDGFWIEIQSRLSGIGFKSSVGDYSMTVEPEQVREFIRQLEGAVRNCEKQRAEFVQEELEKSMVMHRANAGANADAFDMLLMALKSLPGSRISLGDIDKLGDLLKSFSRVSGSVFDLTARVEKELLPLLKGKGISEGALAKITSLLVPETKH